MSCHSHMETAQCKNYLCSKNFQLHNYRNVLATKIFLIIWSNVDIVCIDNVIFTQVSQYGKSELERVNVKLIQPVYINGQVIMIHLVLIHRICTNGESLCPRHLDILIFLTVSLGITGFVCTSLKYHHPFAQAALKNCSWVQKYKLHLMMAF